MHPLQHTVPQAGTPVVVRARLDPPLSRWLWLVKSLLLVPHHLDVSVAARAPVVAGGAVAGPAVGIPLVLVGLLLVVLGATRGRGRRPSPDGGAPPHPGPPATREPDPVAAGTAAG